MDKLKKMLHEEFPNIDFDKEKHLISDKLLDSVDVVSLVSQIEDLYGISITMEYIQPKYFESAEAMWEMVEELK